MSDTATKASALGRNERRTTARRWLVAALLLGLAWRLLRYALCFPFWGDEAYLNLSILHRSFGELLAPLEYAQIAPLLFLWVQRTACILFGGGEYALRAFPLVAGVAALLLFGRLAWRELEPRAATIATAIFAGAYFLVRHTCESKPYAGDLLAATVLMWYGARWLRDPGRGRAALAAAGAAGVLVWLSYPAVFVAAGVSLTLLAASARARRRAAWGWWGLYNLVLLGSFLVFYAVFAAPHVRHAAGSWLEEYWLDAYPPLRDPLALLWWLVRIHTGRMLAYPVGGANFGSSLTTGLCLVGAVYFLRQRRGLTLLLCLAPALPTLAAAALHRYPYGDSVRVSIHLAPSICLLAGGGAAALIQTLRRPRARRVATTAVLLVLAGIPVGGLVRDVLQPYKAYEEAAARSAMQHFARRIQPDEPIAIYNAPEGTVGPPDGPVFYQTLRYYLELYTGRAPRWRAESGLDGGVSWLLVYRGPKFGPEPDRVATALEAVGLRTESVQRYALSQRAPTAVIAYRVRNAATTTIPAPGRDG